MLFLYGFIKEGLNKLLAKNRTEFRHKQTVNQLI